MNRSIWLVALVATSFAASCGEEAEGENNNEPDRVDLILALEGDADAASSNFTQVCADCHSSDGSGSPQGDDLTRISLSDREVTETILSGQGSMPPYASAFTDQEIADLTALVQTFNR